MASFFYPEKLHPDTDTDGVQLSKSATGKADGQWFDYLVNDTDVEAAKKKLVDIKQAIDNGEFGAKPSDFACKYCDFNDICDESVAR
jgi:CRISPR/Cas system-associated exonuclease Cas4 (RecB family)